MLLPMIIFKGKMQRSIFGVTSKDAIISYQEKAWVEAVKQAFKDSSTTVFVIPGGLTSVLQPLDVSINKPIKGYIKQAWVTYMLESTTVNDSLPKKTQQHQKQFCH